MHHKLSWLTSFLQLEMKMKLQLLWGQWEGKCNGITYIYVCLGSHVCWWHCHNIEALHLPKQGASGHYKVPTHAAASCIWEHLESSRCPNSLSQMLPRCHSNTNYPTSNPEEAPLWTPFSEQQYKKSRRLSCVRTDGQRVPWVEYFK